MPHLEIRRLTRSFGGLTAVDHVDLDVAEGELVGIIGPNGAGKTTLFNLITGLDRPDDGTVVFDGQDLTGRPAEHLVGLGIARTFQNGRVFGNLSVADNIRIGAHARLEVARPGWPIVGAVAELARALLGGGRVREEALRLNTEVEALVALFGDRLTPRLDHPAYSLSYANRRRVEIARALAARPRLLLLDEPTAGMNPTETNEMLEIIRHLKGTGLTILLIEHKLDLVMQLSDRVVVMDDGVKIADGSPQRVRHDSRVIEAYLGHAAPGETEATTWRRGEAR